MKSLHLLIACILFCKAAAAQTGGTPVKDLGAPKSPGFQLVDIAPTNIEAPNTPKEFVAGVLQTFDANTGWPQNYSMESTPYWWLKKRGRDVYQFIGITTRPNKSGGLEVLNQNIFSAIKFSSLSASFISKDLIPDTVTSVQRVFAGGLRTRLIRVYQNKHISRLKEKLATWAANPLPEEVALKISMMEDEDEIATYIRNYREQNPDPLSEEIGNLITEKPIFAWDFAAAYATYGIGDSLWKTGRAGVWTTLSSFIPLNYKENTPSTSYLDLLVNARFMYDQYAIAESGSLIKSNHFDIGGKIGFEFNRFSFACEAMYRYYQEDQIDEQHRIVGTINYKVKDGLYINGAYGKNFGDTDNLVSLFGINWGFGSEKIQ